MFININDTITIDTPNDFTNQLTSIIDMCATTNQYNVNKDLYGTLTIKNSKYLDGRGINFNTDADNRGVAIAWLSNNELLNQILTCDSDSDSDKNLCGGVKSKQICACNIAKTVGLISDDKYTECTSNADNNYNYEYITMIDKNPISPTWENMLTNIPSTFNDVFGKNNMTCSVTSQNISSFSDYYKNKTENPTTSNPNSWSKIIAGDLGIAQKLNITSETNNDENGVNKLTIKDFKDLGATFCTSTVALRTYMNWAMDANSEFLGTGFGPNLNSTTTGDPEFITIPNRTLTTLDSIFTFTD